MLTFRTFESMASKVSEHKELCDDYNQQRTAAKREVEEIKAKEGELLNRQISGEDVIDELARTKAKIAVAEEKYRRLVEKIGATNPSINLKGTNVLTLKSEIRTAAASGRLLDETMKDEMEALEEAKQQYLAAAEKALIKFHQVQKYVRTVQEEASSITGEPLGLPEVPTTSVLRPTLWVESNDYNNEFYKVKQSAEAAVNGPMQEVKGVSIPNEMTIPDKKLPTEKEYVDENGVRWERQSVGFEKVDKAQKGSTDPFAGLM
jgi:chromosome segregation ATPase